jgi:hypothetical protein
LSAGVYLSPENRAFTRCFLNSVFVITIS